MWGSASPKGSHPWSPPYAEHMLPLVQAGESSDAAPPEDRDRAGALENRRPRAQLPDPMREVVLDDQRLRNDHCWSVFQRP